MALINDISKDADSERIAADIINISKSVSEESGSNVIVSGLVPRKGYLNTKERNVNNRLRDYSGNCTLTFLKHGNVNVKTHFNMSGLHLNKKGVLLFNENFVNLLNTLDSEIWHKDQNSEGNKTVNTEVTEDSVATDNEIDGLTKFGLLRKKHIKNLLFGDLNINSLRNKREFLEPLIWNHFGIFLVSETKLDFSISESEFTIPGYSLFRKDTNQHGEGLIFYVNQDIFVKLLILSIFQIVWKCYL